MANRHRPFHRQAFVLITAAVLAFGWLFVPAEKAHAHPPELIADLAERLTDSVVNISTTQKIIGRRGIPRPKIPKGSPFEEFFNEFFNRRGKGGLPRKKINSLGSGFVIDPAGLIVTNNHVIEGADEIIVSFHDGSKLKVVEIVGRDSKTDLALLRVTPKKPLKAVKFGDSDKVRVGHWVMAIGNPFGLGGSVSVGIISATKRDINSGPYDDFLQTDAAINRGNSGGPLFDMNGDVIGVNTAIFSPTGGSIGIGFAIPSNTARHVLQQLQKWGETRRGWLGVKIQTITDEIAESLGMDRARGALIATVTPGGPADKAGLQAGDVVLSFNGQPVTTMRVLPKLVARTEIGAMVPITVLRDGKITKLTIKIGRLIENKPVKNVRKLIAPTPRKSSSSRILGLTLAPLNDRLRQKYRIAKTINGVVITDVENGSPAQAKRIRPGNVLLEVTQKAVSTPEEVRERIDELKRNGRRSVLLLLSNGRRELRFVALPITGGKTQKFR